MAYVQRYPVFVGAALIGGVFTLLAWWTDKLPPGDGLVNVLGLFVVWTGGLWWFLRVWLMISNKPTACVHGHTDIIMTYGGWSCRTCYWQRNGRRRSRARRRRSTKAGDR
jgi:hypothetical protein